MLPNPYWFYLMYSVLLHTPPKEKIIPPKTFFIRIILNPPVLQWLSGSSNSGVGIAPPAGSQSDAPEIPERHDGKSNCCGSNLLPELIRLGKISSGSEYGLTFCGRSFSSSSRTGCEQRV